MNIPRLPGLQDRRNNLVNRLFGQYAGGQGQQQSQQQGGGTQFNRYVNPAAMAHTQMTQFDNVPVNIRGLLGAGGMGRALGGDSSGYQGGEVNRMPDMPLPSAPSVPLPGPGVGQPLPTIPQGVSGPTPQPSPATGNSYPGQQTVPNAPGGGAGGPAGTVGGGGFLQDPFLPIPHDAIPLGGGSYWSPTVGIITGSSSGSLAGASSSLGNRYQ